LHVPIDLVGVLCFENLGRWTPMADMPEILDQMVFGHAQPYFFWLFSFRVSAVRSFSLAENVMEAEIWWLAMVVWVWWAMRNRLGDLWLEAVACQWGRQHGRSSSITFQVENSRSGLNWLCLAISFLKALFWEQGFSSGWKPKIYDRETTALVHYFLLGEASLLKKLDYGSCLEVLVPLLQGIDHWTFFFVILLCFLDVCVMPTLCRKKNKRQIKVLLFSKN
jgi:hypothetical protein